MKKEGTADYSCYPLFNYNTQLYRYKKLGYNEFLFHHREHRVSQSFFLLLISKLSMISPTSLDMVEDAECREGGSLYGETDAKYSGTDNPEDK